MQLSRFGTILSRWETWTPVFLIFTGLLLGCTRNRSLLEEGQRVGVAVTIPPQKWLIEKIGGDRVVCHVLVGAKNDPHTYLGTDADAARLARCRLFFTIGLPIEEAPWCQAVLRSRGVTIVSLGEPGEDGHDHADHHGGEQLEEDTHHDVNDDSHEHDHGRHVWLSPRRLIRQAEKIAEALSRLDPSGAAEYQANLARTQEELLELDRELSHKLELLRGQTFFVFHPAWECFAEDYGLIQEAVQVQGKEPSDHEMTELQRKARQTKLKVILVQPQFSSRAAEAIAQVAGLRVVVADPLAEDVPGVLRHVADVLASAYRETSGAALTERPSAGQP